MSKPVRIRPTVCTNRAGDVTAACYAALDQFGLGDDTIIVLSGLSGTVLAERRREIEQLLPQATVIVEQQTGLSRARNAALAAAATGEVVAYIDDDAVVADTWLATMLDTWSGAGPDVAAAGGPIRPLFLVPRPNWLSDDLLSGLSIIDHGTQAITLDGVKQFLYGANLSVSVEHAATVGGFDPARGPIGDGPGFGDDIEMQVRLVAAGFRILYAPGAAVYHRIPASRLRRGSMLRRRYAQGLEQARSQLDARPVVAARGLSVSLARAIGLALTRRPDRSMDNLAYTAQCVGILRGTLGRRTARALPT